MENERRSEKTAKILNGNYEINNQSESRICPRCYCCAPPDSAAAVPFSDRTHIFATMNDALEWVTQGREENCVNNNTETTVYTNGSTTNGTENGFEVEEAAKGTPPPNLAVPLRDPTHIQILCTGSIRLAGALLSIIDPELNSI